eukprot:scaffold10232_cov75-Phaeocystis_antarctica.AAC.7
MPRKPVHPVSSTPCGSGAMLYASPGGTRISESSAIFQGRACTASEGHKEPAKLVDATVDRRTACRIQIGVHAARSWMLE